MTKGHFSALAGYPSWNCYYYGAKGDIAESGPKTHECCDIYENKQIPGVHWSGTLADNVCTVFILQLKVCLLNFNLCGSAMTPRVKLNSMTGILAASL